MSALLHSGKSISSGSLGLNAFTIPWKFKVNFAFPYPALVSLVLSKFLAEHITGHFRLLILVTPYWMEAPGLPLFSTYWRGAPLVSHCEISHQECSSRPGDQRSAITAFMPLAAQRHVLHRQEFSFSVSQEKWG